MKKILKPDTPQKGRVTKIVPTDHPAQACFYPYHRVYDQITHVYKVYDNITKEDYTKSIFHKIRSKKKFSKFKHLKTSQFPETKIPPEIPRLKNTTGPNSRPDGQFSPEKNTPLFLKCIKQKNCKSQRLRPRKSLPSIKRPFSQLKKRFSLFKIDESSPQSPN